MIAAILGLLFALVVWVIIFLVYNEAFWAVTIAICLFAPFLIAEVIKEKKDLKRIARTKILYVFRESTGSAGESTAGKTTFMLYYRDGTKRARTVPNGTKLYNSYMSLTEGD